MKILISVCGLVSIIVCATAVFAKPMMFRASLDDAVKSPYVVLASYQGHEQVKDRSNEDIYLLGFTSTYKLVSVLKQASPGTTKDASTAFEPGKNLNVRYLVHDLSPCMADTSFRFSESLMPPKGSKWILFLASGNNKIGWQTYRGEEGRLEASEPNIAKVKGLLRSAQAP